MKYESMDFKGGKEGIRDGENNSLMNNYWREMRDKPGNVLLCVSKVSNEIVCVGGSFQQ